MDSDPGKSVRMAFGARVREIRRRQGIAQERLALLSGLDRSYMGRVERGERNVTLVNICKIANGLNVSAATLLDWHEDARAE